MAGERDRAAEQLAALEWRDGEVVVDVGGGNGALLARADRARPELRGIVLDLPETVRDEATLGDRIEFVAGSFFDSVPEGDAYVLSGILHDWPDEDAARILRTMRAAAPPHARLLINESVIRPGNDADGAKWLDLLMLVLAGGRERDEAQWRALLEAAGWEPGSAPRERPDRGAAALVPGAHEERREGQQEQEAALSTGCGTPPEQRRDSRQDCEPEEPEDPDGRENSAVRVGAEVRLVVGVSGVEPGGHEERRRRREQPEEDRHARKTSTTPASMARTATTRTQPSPFGLISRRRASTSSYAAAAISVTAHCPSEPAKHATDI